jgi:hypothetical protein
MSPDVAFADLRMIEQSLPLSSRAEVGRCRSVRAEVVVRGLSTTAQHRRHRELPRITEQLRLRSFRHWPHELYAWSRPRRVDVGRFGPQLPAERTWDRAGEHDRSWPFASVRRDADKADFTHAQACGNSAWASGTMIIFRRVVQEHTDRPCLRDRARGYLCAAIELSGSSRR